MSKQWSSAAEAVAGLVRDVDIAPTLYELAGVRAPPDLDGRSLRPALDGEPIARFALEQAEPVSDNDSHA